MKDKKKALGQLIMGMRAAYARGENAMAWARNNTTLTDNTIFSTLIAYDLQAGTYIDAARKNPEYINAWCLQLAKLLLPFIMPGDRLMEVGVGEATTLTGVVENIDCSELEAFGFDLSWSRISDGHKWSHEHSVSPILFVGDLFQIPMADNAIDVVYTSHSLEPNGGKEKYAIKELLRVARKAVVLVEPCYELAPEEARQRMRAHGYVRNLKETAEELGGKVVEYRLLDIIDNPLNPSAVIAIVKDTNTAPREQHISEALWQCPLTGVPLEDKGTYYYGEQVGIAYPVLEGVPLLRPEHAIIASKLSVNAN